MTTEPKNCSITKRCLSGLRSYGRSLVWTDIAFKLIALIGLTPLLGVLFRTLLALSGTAVACDLDILLFFLGPAGWISFIVIGAVWLGIAALEQASLLAILCAQGADTKLGPVDALRFAATKAWPVTQVTTRIVAWTLLATAPFLAMDAAVYFLLLTEHDINYYLKEKPPAFAAAVAIGAALITGLVVLLLRLLMGWIFALPPVLFANVGPRQALSRSAQQARGHRQTILRWMASWAVAMIAVSILASGAVGLAGRAILPDSTDSLRLLTVAVGASLLLWTVINLAVSLLGTVTFAALLFSLYREFDGEHVSANSPVVAASSAPERIRLAITQKRLLAAGAAGIALSLVVGVFTLHGIRLEDNVTVIAHRGSSKAAPENTMAAFYQAIDDRADWIELDVQETADGEVVVMHDSDFMRLAGRSLKIWDATIDNSKDIDIGSWFAAEFRDERTATLGEVLDARARFA